jgi:heterotetrameric sarcosine oxidase gamma subunit
VSKLQDNSALEAFSREWEGLKLVELIDYELVSLAVAEGQDAKFTKQFKSTFDSAIPASNQVLPAKSGWAMWLEPGKYLVMTGERNVNIDCEFAEQFGESAYAVLLSDGWACLHISGHRTLDIFERFIALDMESTPKDFAARTTAHHIAVIIVTLPDGSYLLLTPRSSNQSFLDALLHTAENVLS